MVKQQLAGRMESALLFCSRTLDVLKKIGLLYSATGSGHRILIGFHLDRFTQSWMYCWLLREFAAEDWIAPQRPRAASAHRAALSCSVFCCGWRRACSDILTLLIKKNLFGLFLWKWFHSTARNFHKTTQTTKMRNIYLRLFTLSLPVNRRDAGDGVVVADALCQQPVPDLPGKHCWVLSFVVCDFFHHFRGGHFRFRPTDHSRFDASRFIISVENQLEQKHSPY